MKRDEQHIFEHERSPFLNCVWKQLLQSVRLAVVKYCLSQTGCLWGGGKPPPAVETGVLTPFEGATMNENGQLVAQTSFRHGILEKAEPALGRQTTD